MTAPTLLASGAAIIERLKAACPSAEGRVFSTADLADVAESAQVSPALHVVLLSYRPTDFTPGGAVLWEELWCVVAVVKHAARQDRALALTETAAPLVTETIAALSNWRYPLAEKPFTPRVYGANTEHVWGKLSVTDAPPPAFSDTHAYFPLAFSAQVATPGARN